MGNIMSSGASGVGSHAEGGNTYANGMFSHAENMNTNADGISSHAEGNATHAQGSFSHAEGQTTYASGNSSHTEGQGTTAVGNASHASGRYNVLDSHDNWNEWVANTEYSIGDKVKYTIDNTIVGYICKTANNDSEFNSTNWTRDYNYNYAEIIGNGINANVRSNAYSLDWNGTGRYAGDIYVGCNSDSSGGTKVATVTELAAKLDAADAGLKVVRLI